MFAVEVDNLRKEFFRRDATRTHLRKRRKRVAALEDVTFTMERGECLAILGQNGSGKSTLVRLLSTLPLPQHQARRHHKTLQLPPYHQRLHLLRLSPLLPQSRRFRPRQHATGWRPPRWH